MSCLTECEDNTYGYNCSKNCSCNTTHSDNPEQSCDTESGVCSCRSEWTGPNCNVDVNECTNEDLCAHIKFSDCHNLDGGYSCECLRGFSKNANSECVPGTIVNVIYLRAYHFFFINYVIHAITRQSFK